MGGHGLPSEAMSWGLSCCCNASRDGSSEKLQASGSGIKNGAPSGSEQDHPEPSSPWTKGARSISRDAKETPAKMSVAGREGSREKPDKQMGTDAETQSLCSSRGS